MKSDSSLLVMSSIMLIGKIGIHCLINAVRCYSFIGKPRDIRAVLCMPDLAYLSPDIIILSFPICGVNFMRSHHSLQTSASLQQPNM